MGLKDLEIKKSYTSYGTENIANSFLVPALKYTKVYRRSAGFFSSSVLEALMDGIVSLARNGGKIQLIASPRLSEEDIQAISLGYAKREEIIDKAFSRDFVDEIEEMDELRLQLLYQLIAQETLDIRIAVTERIGIYHDKLGILEDFNGDVVVFYGSANATGPGYQNNYEKIRTVKSWIPTDAESIADEQEEFENLWNGVNPFVKVYPYKESAKKNILTIVERKREEKAAGKNDPIQLRDYQEEAIASWMNNGSRGFYVMATGTGKTWTAIYSVKRLLETHPAMTVICAPYKHLVRQWAEDVARALPDASLILVSSENPRWEQELTEAIVQQRLKKDTQIVVISTIVSFNLERFQRTIKKSKQEKILIVDEAHRFTKRPDSLKEQFKYLLGLSATPFSGRNTAKGEELMQFFGGQVFDLPIEAALDKGFLVKYYYHPIFVHATDSEESEFNKKSILIASCFRNGVCIDPENLALHLRARLRIIAMAQEKIDRIKEILAEVQERNHFIVYCGDGRLYNNNEEIRHIQFVKRTLSDLGFKSSQFTATENMAERMELVEAFNEGSIDALAAIRCLDEGINIPSITGALILASNDDYREFVQRRGRILRTYGNKKYANIYDVIVLPSHEATKMAEIEFRRFYEYARLAINQEELLSKLELLAGDYGLTLEDFVTTFDEGKEAALDD